MRLLIVTLLLAISYAQTGLQSQTCDVCEQEFTQSQNVYYEKKLNEIDATNSLSHAILGITSLTIVTLLIYQFYAFWYYEYKDRKESSILVPPPTDLLCQFSWTSPNGQYSVNMEVPIHNKQGELCLILGTSGAGKTSLLESLAGIRRHGSIKGSIKINGVEQIHSAHSRGSQIDFMRQEDPSLIHYKDVTGWDIIYLKNIAKNPGFSLLRDVENSNFSSMFKTLGLTDDILSRKWTELSGGQKTRVRLCSAIMQPRPIIIVDEVTTGLDAGTAYSTMRLLQKLTRKYQLCMLATIHQPSGEIIGMASNVALLTTDKTSQGCLHIYMDYSGLLQVRKNIKDISPELPDFDLLKEVQTVGTMRLGEIHAVSITLRAPLETIRDHPMAGAMGRLETESNLHDPEDSVEEIFQNIEEQPDITFAVPSYYLAIAYRSIKLIYADGYQSGRNSLKSCVFLSLCLGLLNMNVASPLIFHFSIYMTTFMIFVSLNVPLAIMMERDYWIFSSEDNISTYPSSGLYIIYWMLSIVNLMTVHMFLVGVAFSMMVFCICWSSNYVDLIGYVWSCCVFQALFSSSLTCWNVLRTNALPLSRPLVPTLLTMLTVLCGMIFPWSAVHYGFFRHLKKALPSYWMATCISVTAHQTQGRWKCRDLDDVTCIVDTSGQLVDFYGLDEGKCDVAFGYSLVLSLFLLVLGLRAYYKRATKQLDFTVMDIKISDDSSMKRSAKSSIESKGISDYPRSATMIHTTLSSRIHTALPQIQQNLERMLTLADAATLRGCIDIQLEAMNSDMPEVDALTRSLGGDQEKI